jgi:hypothetical protein
MKIHASGLGGLPSHLPRLTAERKTQRKARAMTRGRRMIKELTVRRRRRKRRRALIRLQIS